ncbi:MAG: NHL repeat-containing protein [Planctomycetota bacterium]
MGSTTTLPGIASTKALAMALICLALVGGSASALGDPVPVLGTHAAFLGVDNVVALAHDPNTQTLYGSDGGRLLVIDTATGLGNVVGPIGFTSVSGLAFDADTNTLYGANRQTGQLLEIDPATGAATAITPPGVNGLLGDIAFDPNTGTLYGLMFSGISDKLFTVDTLTGVAEPIPTVTELLLGTIALTFDPTTDTLYGMNTFPSLELVTVDTTTGGSAAVPPGPLGIGGPRGLAFDRDTDSLYGTDTSTHELFTIDPATGVGAAVGPLGLDRVTGLAFDPGSNLLLGADSASDQLFTIDPSGFDSEVLVSLEQLAITALAIDPDSDTLFAFDEMLFSLLTIDPATGQGVELGGAGFTLLTGLAFDPNTNTLYGSDIASNQLIAIDPVSGDGVGIGGTGALGFFDVQGLAFDPAGDTLYGADVATDQLITIDTATGVGTAVGPLGFGEVQGLAFDTTTNTLYGTDTATDQLIKIVGMPPPVCACEDLIVATDPGQCTATVACEDIVSCIDPLGDPIDPQFLSCDPSGPYPLGATQVLVTVAAPGLAPTEITCTVNVVDQEDPVIACPADVIVECDGMGNQTELANFLASATATDNCSTVTPVVIQNDFSTTCGSAGVHVVVWRVVDDAGNEATCSATFTIEDTQDPLVSCPPFLTLECGEAVPPPFANLAEFLTAGGSNSEACDPDLQFTLIDETSTVDPTCPGAVVIERTYFVEDGCDNTASCTQVIGVLDTTGPQLGCPPGGTVGPGDAIDVTVPADDVCDPAPVVTAVATAGGGNVVITENGNGQFNIAFNALGTTTIEFTATDACGNTTTCEATYVIADLAVTARNPGSVGIFPVHRSGTDPEGAGAWFTIVSVTNTNLQPQTPQGFGGSTNVHFEYVNTVRNPANPFLPLGCSVFDRVEFLTPADTLSVLTSCHDATAPGGQEGYLVVSAQDPAQAGVPWSHNHLVGSELVVNASGGLYGLEMISVASPLAPGAPTDLPDPLTGDPPNGRLDFDGAEYSALPDALMIDSFIALVDSRLTLLNLTGGAQARNTVAVSAWNDNEFPLSTTLTFSCWFDEPLSSVSPLFTQGFLAFNTPNDPGEVDLRCDGIGVLETAWARIDSIGVAQPGGTPIATDGVLLGAITAGPGSLIDGGRLLWESPETQPNGAFLEP